MKDTLNLLSNPALIKQIARSKSFYARQREGQSFEAVFGEPLARKKRQQR